MRGRVRKGLSNNIFLIPSSLLLLIAAIISVVLLLMSSTQAAPQFKVAAIIEPIASGIVEGIGTYDVSAVVILRARPAQDYLFTHWLTSSLPQLSGSNANPLTFTMPSHDVEVTAVFKQADFVTLVVNTNASAITIPHPDKVRRSNTITLNALVEILLEDKGEKYVFVAWTGDASSKDKSLRLTMDTNKAVTALYKKYLRFGKEWFPEQEFTTLQSPPIPLGDGTRLEIIGWRVTKLNITLPAASIIPNKYAASAEPITVKQHLVTIFPSVTEIQVEAELNGKPVKIPGSFWLKADSRLNLVLPKEVGDYNLIGNENIDDTLSGPLSIKAEYKLDDYAAVPKPIRKAWAQLVGFLFSGPDTPLGFQLPVPLLMLSAILGLAVTLPGYRANRPKKSSVLEEMYERRNPFRSDFRGASSQSPEFFRYVVSRDTVIHSDFEEPKRAIIDYEKPAAPELPKPVQPASVVVQEQPKPVPKTPTEDMIVEQILKGELDSKQKLTASMFERLSNMTQEYGKVLEYIENGLLTPSFDKPPVVKREKEVEQLKKLLAETGLRVISPSGTGKEMLVERALEEIGTKYLAGDAEENEDSFISNILPKDLRHLDAGEAFRRLSGRGFTHIVVRNAEIMKSYHKLLQYASFVHTVFISARESEVKLTLPTYEPPPYNYNELVWIALGDLLHRKKTPVDPKFLNKLAEYAEKHSGAETLHAALQIAQKANEDEANSIVASLEEERKRQIYESLDQACREFEEEAKKKAGEYVTEHEVRETFNSLHKARGIEAKPEHFDDTLAVLQALGFKAKFIRPAPLKDLARIIKGEVEEVFYLTPEGYEAAAEMFETPKQLLEAYKNGRLRVRWTPETKCYPRLSERVKPIVNLVLGTKSFLLIGHRGSGRRTALRKALEDNKTPYLMTDDAKTLNAVLKSAYDRVELKVKSSTRGRASFQDHLTPLPDLATLGIKYLVLCLDNLTEEEDEKVPEVVKACHAAKLSTAIVSEADMEIEGTEKLEQAPYTLTDAYWISLSQFFIRGLPALEEKNVELLGRLPTDDKTAEADIGLLVRVAEKVREGTHKEIGDVWQLLLQEQKKVIEDELNEVERAAYEKIMEHPDAPKIITEDLIAECYKKACQELGKPFHRMRLSRFKSKLRRMGYSFGGVSSPDLDERFEG